MNGQQSEKPSAEVDARYASIWHWCSGCGSMQPGDHVCTHASEPKSEAQQMWERDVELARQRGYAW